MLVKLFDKVKVTTAGNLIGGNPASTEVESAEFSDLLPICEEITLVSLTENATSNFQWNLYFYSGYTRSTELTSGAPFAIGQAITGPGAAAAASKRHSPYTTTTNFLLESRLLIGCGNVSGSNAEPATLSAALLMKTVGM